MPRPRQYREWSLQQRLPSTVTPEHAREIMLDCFATVHGPHFAVTKAEIGMRVDEATVLRSVKGTLRLAFSHSGGDYDRPDREALIKVAQYLYEKSLSWGTPHEVVARHHNQLMRVLARVPADSN